MTFDLESVVNFALEHSECPLCGIRMATLWSPPAAIHPDLIRNIWRHHITTAHSGEVGR